MSRPPTYDFPFSIFLSRQYFKAIDLFIVQTCSFSGLAFDSDFFLGLVGPPRNSSRSTLHNTCGRELEFANLNIQREKRKRKETCLQEMEKKKGVGYPSQVINHQSSSSKWLTDSTSENPNACLHSFKTNATHHHLFWRQERNSQEKKC